MIDPTVQSEDRIPVIVGIGEISDHPVEITAGREPLTLMVDALKQAEQDSGGKSKSGQHEFLPWTPGG